MCDAQTWAGIALASILVLLVVVICFRRKEITWSAVTMALVALVFAGATSYTEVIFGPSRVELRRDISVLRSQLEKSTQEMLELRERLERTRLAVERYRPIEPPSAVAPSPPR